MCSHSVIFKLIKIHKMYAKKNKNVLWNVYT